MVLLLLSIISRAAAIKVCQETCRSNEVNENITTREQKENTIVLQYTNFVMQAHYRNLQKVTIFTR